MRCENARRWLGLMVSVVVLAVLIFVGVKCWSALRGPASSHRVSEKTFELVNQIHGESKLVVATMTTTVRLDLSDSWYVFNLLYFGETVVKLRVDDCKVQFYVPGDRVRLEDFQYDREGHHLTVTLPRPVLDEAVVDIPSDPSCWSVYKSSGWARWDKNKIEDTARAALRGRVLEAARGQGWDRQLDLVARDSLTQMIRGFYKDGGMVVEVRWR